MLIDERGTEASVDGADRYKRDQAAFFDAQPAAWETSRPHGAPALYRWLMEEKFRRSVDGLQSVLPGATVLTVCGGSGMDAEFLARAGARVIASDISLGAARRALERSRRHGVPITPIVSIPTTWSEKCGLQGSRFTASSAMRCTTATSREHSSGCSRGPGCSASPERRSGPRTSRSGESETS